MKKIFTLLFSMGLVACTFAQSGRHQQDQNSGNNYQPTQNSRNSKWNNKGYSSSNTYSRDEQFNQRNNNNGYGYGNADRDRNDGFKNDHDRYDRGGDWRDRDHHNDRDDRYARQYTRVRVQRDYYSQPRVPLLQIILGIGGR
ncbi:MAG: hypothetical protein ABI358_12110 [Ginsengibacter sp.]